MYRDKFYDVVRNKFGALSQSQVDGFEKLIDTAEARRYPLNQFAYLLATTWHETAATMQPIAEYGKGQGHEYGKPLPQYGNQKAYGRGYVQLTWYYNYEKADAALRLNGALLKNFELALDPKIAAQIIFQGMSQGWFTSKALGQFVSSDNHTLKDYYNARMVVNGHDDAELIKGYAEIYETGLEAAGYTTIITTPAPQPVPQPVPEPIEEPDTAPRGIFKFIMELLTKLFGRRK